MSQSAVDVKEVLAEVRLILQETLKILDNENDASKRNKRFQ
ncbi:MAG: hypothetical protein NWF00_06700 [Candidatus Bathyarchaeota archaeon]|nr:hypothetical protein [Candidatus Bathyarchaeota archaeon]